MLITLIVLRLALSAVFGVAGVAKLLDQRGTRDAVINFGAPQNWSGPLALFLPLAELVIALGLLFSATAWGSALSAFFLLALFIAAIAVNLSRGKAPECHCFGQLYSRPLGWPTLVRNIGFAICSGFVVSQSRRTIETSTQLLSERLAGTQYFPLVALMTLAIVVVTVIYFQRERAKRAVPSQSHPASDLQGLPLGAPAPAFQLPAYRRHHTSLTDLLEPAKPLLLIFSNPNCGPCAALFGELAEWQRSYPEQVTIAVLTQGTLKENFVNIARNDLRNILFQNGREIAEEYQCLATPTGVLVSPDGRIASKPAAGADKIRELIHSTLEDQDSPVDPAGARIPDGYLPQVSTQNAD